MSKAASSPTARLLQSSRLFSLPRPLPQPTLEPITSTGQYRASDTATIPYPTRQAVATPASSLFRGDWGLKRALPRKAIKGSSTPHIRISAQDTPYGITDFGSAADHTQTAAKWLEMGIPILSRPQKGRPGPGQGQRAAPRSVFEEDVDNTEVDHRAGPSSYGTAVRGQDKQRWKYSGPWLAGMQDGDFVRYTRHIEKRKGEWREYLKSHVAEQRLADRRRQAQDEGEVMSLETINTLREELRPSDQELLQIEKDMRDTHTKERLYSELTALITSFLDLPSVVPSDSASEFASVARNTLLQEQLSGLTGDADSAPPSTHPSAGLSYLRTAAIMPNHPLHGPQGHASPVLSRVLRARNSAQGTIQQAKVGVGGIVANDPVSAAFRPSGTPSRGTAADGMYDPDEMANVLDVDMEGGNKMYVHPQYASVDENGRIRLQITRGDREAIAVKTKNVDAIHESRAASTRYVLPSAGFVQNARPGEYGNANYGTRLPDARRAGTSGGAPEFGRNREQHGESERPARGRRPVVKGFDEEYAQGRLDNASAAAQLRELVESRKRDV